MRELLWRTRSSSEGTPFIVLTQKEARPNLFMSFLQALRLRPAFVYGPAEEVEYLDPAHYDFHLPVGFIVDRALSSAMEEMRRHLMAGTSEAAAVEAPAVPIRVRAAPTVHGDRGRSSLLIDLSDGLANWHAWVFKGWYDILLRYRRTLLGPIWMVLTTGVMIACLSLVGPALFGGGDPNFIPYMIAGIISWNFLSLGVTEGSSVFIEAAR